ncbi:MAG: hypothetical protein JHC95_23060, partial [Solirubrobacteraceae bacterium]|nr:hypothetical protein [Solirubrobacteraceae bacterium]
YPGYPYPDGGTTPKPQETPPAGDPAPVGPAGPPAATPVPGPKPFAFAQSFVPRLLKLSRKGAVSVPCRMSTVGSARSCRITITPAGKGSRTRLGRQTAKLVKGQAVVKVALSSSGRRAVRRAGRRGLRVIVKVEALDAAGKTVGAMSVVVRLKRP